MTDTVIARFEGDGSGVAVATPAEPSAPRAELTRSTLTWSERGNVAIEKVFLYINDISDALCYELPADSHYAAPAMGAVR